jgi:AraC family transcriptional regulator
MNGRSPLRAKRVGVSAASSQAHSRELPGLRITDVRYGPGFRTPRHDHEHDCATIALGGSLAKELRGAERVLESGAVAVTPAETAHVDRFGARGGRAVVVEVRDGLGGAVGESLRVGWLGRRLASELRATDAAAPLALHGAALELLAILRRATARAEKRAPGWLDDVTEYLHANKLERITLDELATLAGVHRTHLVRTFRAFHGVPVGAYVRRLRVEWAADALLDEGVSLTEIAARAGFADQSHFTRIFAGHFGIPPGRWRSDRRRERLRFGQSR